MKEWSHEVLLGVLAVLLGVLAATGAGLVVWWKGFLKEYLPSPKRVVLALRNVREGKARPIEDRFRVVLCWLENDPNGDNVGYVERAFQHTKVEGFTLFRCARIVAASGAPDEWREAMQKRARSVLKNWHADLAVVGLVEKPAEVLSLWFVPRSGTGTLDSKNQEPYVLSKMRLGPDFNEDFCLQLTTAALVAVAPLGEIETRGQVLEKGLRDAADKLTTLLNRSTEVQPERRARLLPSLGNALLALGEREGGTERLERAVDAYRAALEEDTRERVPLDWATIQNNLGSALCTLGERDTGTERLERGVEAYRAALEERTRERMPRSWAATKSNLGNALRALGERERGTERLEQAVDAHRAALEEYIRKRVPLNWAMTQNNLGVALQALGERERGTERLEQAVDAHRAALEVRTRERVPLSWATTQNNLGNVLQTLGTRERGTKRLERAVDAYCAALEERTRERVPLSWAATQNSPRRPRGTYA